MRPLPVALYARVSTSDQHCEQQLSALREYATARKWEVQGEYIDHGVSGKKVTRPALDRLMRAARLRQIDCIIVWKLDRWARSMTHFVSSVQDLHSMGVRFIAISQGIDTDGNSPTAKLLMNLLAAFAEFEHDLIVERTLAGLMRARKQGRVGGRPRLVVNRAKVRQMDADGMTTREIGAEMGISAASVCRMLRADA